MAARVAVCWLLAVVCWAGAVGASGTVLAPLLLAWGIGWFLYGTTWWEGGRA